MNTASYYQYHVFFCLNEREDGANCCSQHGASQAFDYMKSKIKKLNMNGKNKVRINRAGCLDRCAQGPLMVVYPQAVWYTFVDEGDLDEIIQRHLGQGEIVQRLVVA